MLNSPALSKYLIVLIPAAMLLYATSRPVSRLRLDMPASFVLVSAHADSAERAAAATVAQAYWNVAVERLQWRCGFGCSLPADPPDDFRISDELFEARLDSRALYWGRLRKAWTSPASWRTEREWSTTWLTRPASRFMQWISDYEHSILGS
jgi:hypothetical protein